MNREEFEKLGIEHYGENQKEWVFVCPWCDFHQSIESIRMSMKTNGFHQSKRFGKITPENVKQLNPDVTTECLSADCNYAAYGLFGGNMEVDGRRYLEFAFMVDKKVPTP